MVPIRQVTIGPDDSLEGYLAHAAGGDVVTISPRTIEVLDLPASSRTGWVSLRALGSTAHWLVAGPGSQGWSISGLTIARKPTLADTDEVYDLVNLGVGCSRIALDSVIIRGTRRGWTRRGLSLNGADLSIVSSFIEEIHVPGQDAQAICGWEGPGPFLIEDCDLEAATENIMFGGVDPGPQAIALYGKVVPSDITIRRSSLWKSGTTLAGGWVCKNIFEIKNGQRVLVEDCELRDFPGVAVVLTVRNQDGTAPWSACRDVLIHRCKVRNVGTVMSGHTTDDGQPSTLAERVALKQIDAQNIRDSFFYWGPGRPYAVMNDLEISHSTALPTRNAGFWIETTVDPDGLAAGFRRLRLADNLMGFGSFTGQPIDGLKVPGVAVDSEIRQNALPNAGDVDGAGPDRNQQWSFDVNRFISIPNTVTPVPDASAYGIDLATGTVSPGPCYGTATDGKNIGVTKTEAPSMQAVFLGQSDKDYAAPSTDPAKPGGLKDWHIRLSALKSVPRTILIEAPNDQGTWVAPANGNNWVIATLDVKPGQLDCFYEPYGPASPRYKVTVTFPDDSVEIIDALPASEPEPEPVPPLSDEEVTWVRALRAALNGLP